MGTLKFNIFLILAFSSIYHAQLISSKELPSVITLKVLLVEFQDVEHRNPNYPINLSLPAYTFNDFNNMLFSRDSYYSPNMYSPDSDSVFGSLRDYYRIMSNNKLDINGCILNEDANSDGIPDWIVLNNSKKFYQNNHGDLFRKHSKNQASAKGININTNSDTFLVIIYAGHTYRKWGNNLTPSAHFKDHDYIMGERFVSGFPYCEERDDSTTYSISHFAHIGIHAHEFGHLLGFSDHSGPEDNYNWDIMSSGVFNGPNKAGACPAPINPYDRARLGWLQIIRFGDSTTVKMQYDLKNPHIYYMEDPKTFDFFLVEFRDFNSKMNLGNINIPDYNSNITNMREKNGLLVWRKIKKYNVKLLHACSQKCSNPNHQILPGEENVRVLNPWSDNRNAIYGSFWIPNTKPADNCGLEIKSINEDHYVVDLYQKNPWLTSPSKINQLEYVKDREIILSWEQKLEPDLAYYKIYMMNSDSIYRFFDTTFSNNYEVSNKIYSLTFNDSNFAYYKVSTIDLNDNESVFSNEIKIFVGNNTLSNSEKCKDTKINFSLSQNYPNPFNPTTIIKYQLPANVKSEKANVQLVVYDILGREVVKLVNQNQKPGHYEAKWNATEQVSGIYFYKLRVYNPGRAGDFVETKKMILLK